MKTNSKQTYLPVKLEIIRWDEADDIVTASGFGGPKITGHTAPAYTRYEEDESEE